MSLLRDNDPYYIDLLSKPTPASNSWKQELRAFLGRAKRLTLTIFLISLAKVPSRTSPSVRGRLASNDLGHTTTSRYTGIATCMSWMGAPRRYVSLHSLHLSFSTLTRQIGVKTQSIDVKTSKTTNFTLVRHAVFDCL